MGHTEPDGDCISSQLALVHWLRRLGKKAQAFSSGPFDRPEAASYKSKFKTQISYDNDNDNNDNNDHNSYHIKKEKTAAIIVDCSLPERTGDIGKQIKGLPCLVIDHHASGKAFGDLRLIDPASPSTTLLILKLIRAFGYEPDLYEAELLLFGFCTDTGFFRHLDNTASQEALIDAACLVKTGVSLQDIYRKIYAGKELDQYKLLGKLLLRTESYAGGRILVSWQTLEDKQARDGKEIRGSDDLYKHLQSVRDNKVVVLIKEEGNGECSIGLRSHKSFDVGELAKSFGGGGHCQASGYMRKGNIDEIKHEILAKLKNSGFNF